MALGKIEFKSFTVLQNALMVNMHPFLIEVLKDFYETVGNIVITSTHREGDSGVHGTRPYRGIDIRSSNLQNPVAAVGLINDRWLYDHSRPSKMVALLHDTGRGEHIHLQVHPSTRRK